jgi:hypothetical protein
MTEIVVESFEPLEIDRVLIYPYNLHDLLLLDGALSPEKRVVEHREPIIGLRIAIRRAAAGGCTCRTQPNCHWSASNKSDRFAPDVKNAGLVTSSQFTT